MNTFLEWILIGCAVVAIVVVVLLVFILAAARRAEEMGRQLREIEPMDLEEGDRYRRMLHRFMVSRPTKFNPKQ